MVFEYIYPAVVFFCCSPPDPAPCSQTGGIFVGWRHVKSPDWHETLMHEWGYCPGVYDLFASSCGETGVVNIISLMRQLVQGRSTCSHRVTLDFNIASASQSSTRGGGRSRPSLLGNKFIDRSVDWGVTLSLTPPLPISSVHHSNCWVSPANWVEDIYGYILLLGDMFLTDTTCIYVCRSIACISNHAPCEIDRPR